MPTIEGSVEEAGRIIVVDENTGGIDSNTVVASGTYSVSSSSLDPKIVLFRRGSDGNTLGYSGITSLDDSPFLGESGTFANGVDMKFYGYGSGVMVGDSKFLFIFRSVLSPNTMSYTIGTVSGQSVSFNEPAVLSATAANLYYDSTYDKILHVSNTQYRVCTLSGNTLNVGSATNFSSIPGFAPEGQVTYGIVGTYYNQDTHQLLVLYIRIPDLRYVSGQDTIFCYLRAVVGTFDGTSFSFGSYITIDSFTTFWYYRSLNTAIAYYPETGGYCIVYCRVGNDYTAYMTMLEISGSTVTEPYSRYSTGGTTSDNVIGICHDSNRDLFFVSVSQDGTGFPKNTIIPYSYSNGVFTRLSHTEIYCNYGRSQPILDFDYASSKILFLSDYSGSIGSACRYRVFDYNHITDSFSYDTVTYDNSSGYPNAVFLRDPDTGKRVVVYSSTADYIGKAKVFRV